MTVDRLCVRTRYARRWLRRRHDRLAPRQRQRIALAALLFGLFRALSNVYSGIDILASLNISSSIYNMMPYVISLVVLAFTSKHSRAPKAEGIPYDKGQR